MAKNWVLSQNHTHKLALILIQLCGQRVKYVSCTLERPIRNFYLPLFDHSHHFNSIERDWCGVEWFKSKHNPWNSLNSTMILFHNVVEIFNLTYFNICMILGIVGFDCWKVGTAFIDVAFSGNPLLLMALMKNLLADFLSLFFVSRKSMVLFSLSTALYK